MKKTKRYAQELPAPEMPMPPFPTVDNEIMKLIWANAMHAFESGETDVAGAIQHAVVHAWMEGHLEGETCKNQCAEKAAQALSAQLERAHRIAKTGRP